MSRFVTVETLYSLLSRTIEISAALVGLESDQLVNSLPHCLRNFSGVAGLRIINYQAIHDLLTPSYNQMKIERSPLLELISYW